MSQISKRNRYRGAMLGTHIGDALGAPYEWKWTPQQIKANMDAHGGLVPQEFEPFDYLEPWKGKHMVEKGQPTDDSELAAALALSFIEKKGFDPEDAYNRLRSFIHGRKSILADGAYGSGGTLRAALKPESYDLSNTKFALDEIPTPPSNGSLMRCIAVPLYGRSDFNQMLEIASKQSQITHRNPECVAACVAFSVMVWHVLSGMAPRDAWEKTTEKKIVFTLGGKDPNMHWAVEEILRLPISKPDYVHDMGGKYNPDGSADTTNQKFGSVLLSLRVAVWAASTAESFADGIVKAISVGGDTDTYAAIAGGILGAHYGLKGIPRKWQDAMQGRQTMLDLADRLYEMSCS